MCGAHLKPGGRRGARIQYSPHARTFRVPPLNRWCRWARCVCVCVGAFVSGCARGVETMYTADYYCSTNVICLWGSDLGGGVCGELVCGGTNRVVRIASRHVLCAVVPSTMTFSVGQAKKHTKCALNMYAEPHDRFTHSEHRTAHVSLTSTQFACINSTLRRGEIAAPSTRTIKTPDCLVDDAFR